MKRTAFFCLAILIAAALACNAPQTAVLTATPGAILSPTPLPASPTQPPPPSPSPIVPPPAAPTVIFITPANPLQPALPPTASVPPTAANPAYAVVLVEENDNLNVRKEPGANGSIVDRLPFDATGILPTGKQSPVGDQRWVEIQHPDGGSGWVNALYLTEYIPRDIFCSDPRPTALLGELGEALRQKDGRQLARLVSPTHGLDITYFRSGNTANYTSDEARWVFESDYETNWGVHPASGKTTKGTFQDVVLPDLLDTLDNQYITTCNNLVLESGNYTYQWPARYRNFNFYSVHKPGSPGNELAWRTWLAGYEMVNGEPYLSVLIHLFWEP
jgi:hypothetical protein